jgi:hypothetical protein
LTLPAVFNAVQKHITKTNYRNTYQQLNEATYQLYMDGQLEWGDTLKAGFRKILLYEEEVSNNCGWVWAWSNAGSPSACSNGGFILQNGMYLGSISNFGSYKYVYVDINGSAPPNVVGQDGIEWKVFIQPDVGYSPGLTSFGELTAHRGQQAMHDSMFK